MNCLNPRYLTSVLLVPLHRGMFIWFCLLVGSCPVACGKGNRNPATDEQKKEPPQFEYKNEPANLQLLMEQILTAPPRARLSDVKRHIALARALVPDDTALAAAFLPGAVKPDFKKRFDAFRQRASDDLMALRIFLPMDRAMTRVAVHSIRVEEIAQGKLDEETEHGKAFDGTTVAAPRYLKPELRVHQIVVSDPETGKTQVFHLFFWDGTQWKSLGPFWSDHRMRAFLGQESVLFPGQPREKKRPQR